MSYVCLSIFIFRPSPAGPVGCGHRVVAVRDKDRCNSSVNAPVCNYDLQMADVSVNQNKTLFLDQTLQEPLK